MESSKFREDDNEPDPASLDDEHLLFYPSTTKKEPNPDWNDALGEELGVNVLDCRKPFIPFDEFYNEPLSDAIEMDNDYLYYKNRQGGMYTIHSFLLRPHAQRSHKIMPRQKCVFFSSSLSHFRSKVLVHVVFVYFDTGNQNTRPLL